MAGGGDKDITMCIEVKPVEMTLKWSVEDSPDKSVNFTYDGVRENEVRIIELKRTEQNFRLKCLGSKFTAACAVEESGVMPGRMPGGTIVIKYSVSGNDYVKEERYQFHGPNRMIVETIAAGAAMITTYERQQA